MLLIKNIQFLLVLSFILANFNLAKADDLTTKKYKYYDVEIVLFKHNNATGLTSEYWDVIDSDNTNIDELTPDTLNSDASNDVIDEKLQKSKIRLANYQVNEHKFTPFDKRVSLIEKINHLLNKESDHLKYSKNYNLLSHIAWKQPGFNESEALPIEFIFNTEKHNITGNIKIILKRYLHAKVDFDLTQEVCRTIENEEDILEKVKIDVQLTNTKQDETGTSPVTEKILVSDDTIVAETVKPKIVCQIEKIKFKQSRKMRSRELHYIDHPVFGLLIQITPSKEQPEPASS